MSRTQRSRTPLSMQAGVLRASLFLSLGLSPLACGGSASGGEAGGTTPVVACSDPVLDVHSGLVSCSNGLLHRTEATTCAFSAPGAAGASGAGASGASGASGTAGAASIGSYCSVDANCAALPLGYCDRLSGGGMPRCKSGCAKDSDCGGGICICSTNPGRCVDAVCSLDADCGPNSLCALAHDPCGNGTFQCTTPQDACVTNSDCGTGTCTSYDRLVRVCSDAACGRPFLIAESPRMASIQTRADWLDATVTPNLSGLTPTQRAQLAAHWAHLGRMEHASIAAFARFQLQLLSLGAPSDLVEACNRALADETAHARMCFALASAYGGMPMGPARLDIQHCFEDTSLAAIAKLVLREGCLGETVASLEALAAAETATDPAVKQALTRIAHDELQHAELAFKFLRWALSQLSDEARHEVAREAAQQLANFEGVARDGARTRSDDALVTHGLLAGDALRTIRLAAVRDVSRPLLAALFDLETTNHA